MRESTPSLCQRYEIEFLNFGFCEVVVSIVLICLFCGFLQGSSKAGTIGEVSVDFADYAEATKPFSVSLPLKNSNSNSNAVLHVSTLLFLLN